LERVLAETSTTHVDFLSLDVEGAELYGTHRKQTVRPFLGVFVLKVRGPLALKVQMERPELNVWRISGPAGPRHLSDLPAENVDIYYYYYYYT
jgi:hypothetical protein